MSEFKLYIAQHAWEILGIAKTAPEEQVRATYKALALRCHPDKVNEADRDTATAEFQEIQAAYEYCLAHPYVEPIPFSSTAPPKEDHHAAKSSRHRNSKPNYRTDQNSKVTPQQRLNLFQRQVEALSNRVPTFGLQNKSRVLQNRKEQQRRAMEVKLTQAVKRAEASKSQPEPKPELNWDHFQTELPVRAYPLSSFFV